MAGWGAALHIWLKKVLCTRVRADDKKILNPQNKLTRHLWSGRNSHYCLCSWKSCNLLQMTFLFLLLCSSHTYKFCLNRCLVSITKSVIHQQTVSGNQRISESSSDRKSELWDPGFGETSAFSHLPTSCVWRMLNVGLDHLKFLLIIYWEQILCIALCRPLKLWMPIFFRESRLKRVKVHVLNIR